MKNRYTHIFSTGARSLMQMAVLCGGMTMASTATAQCEFDLTGVVIQPNCGMNDGMIEIFTSEGADIYMIVWSTGDIGPLITELAPGYYSVTVIDWNGCETTAEFHLSCGDDDPGGEEPWDPDCTLKTFTQGGWGSPPNGNNPGMYLHNNFSAAFPNGITLGCTRQLRLTSASAITTALPGGGPPAKLKPGVETDPNKIKNVLAAQLLAATLNVGMDANYASFAPSPNNLGNAIITQGPFNGYTVQQLLGMANAFIGDCGGNGFSAGQYNEALSSINENFVDGNVDNGFLSCAPGTKSLDARESLPVTRRVFPNPASSNLTTTMEFTRAAVVQVDLVDATGRIAVPSQVVQADSGIMDLTMDVSSLKEGMYFLRVVANGSMSVTRVVVTR